MQSFILDEKKISVLNVQLFSTQQSLQRHTVVHDPQKKKQVNTHNYSQFTEPTISNFIKYT